MAQEVTLNSSGIASLALLYFYSCNAVLALDCHYSNAITPVAFAPCSNVHTLLALINHHCSNVVIPVTLLNAPALIDNTPEVHTGHSDKSKQIYRGE